MNADKISIFSNPEYVERSILLPAVKNLRLASAQDPGLLSWLDLLELKSSSIKHTGPEAFATMENGLPVVEIDMSFVLKCFWISDLAGLIMTRPSENSMYILGEQYGQAVGKSITAGELPPPIKFNPDKIDLQPGQDVCLKSMGHLAFGAAIQWVVLHEIGHHQLKHFERNPRDFAESREWELAADSWAIERMQHLGYGLDPLEAVMGAFLCEEEIQSIAGLVKPIEYSEHPSWAQRLANLKTFDTQKPSSTGIWKSILIVSAEPVTGEFYANELWIPNQSMPSVMCLLNDFGHTIRMPVEFAADGSIHIYGRSPKELSEIIVTNLETLYPDVRFKHTDLSTGQTSISETRGYQFDKGFILSTSLKGIEEFTIKDALQLDPNSMFKEHLLEVETKPEIVSEVMKLQEQATAGINEVVLEYAKGIVDLQTAQQMATRLSSDQSVKLRQLVGENKYKKIQAILSKHPIIASCLGDLQIW